MYSRPYADGDFRLMLELVSELWPGGRHGPGYAFMAQRLPYNDWELRLWFDGGDLAGWAWSAGWRGSRWLSYEFRDRELLPELLDWASPDRTTATSDDEETASLLAACGFVHDPEAPWIRLNSRALRDVEIEEPLVPAGYRLATMAEYGDFASRSAAHRSAFRPSRFTDRVYRVVREETPWRADLDCVVVAPDGSVAAYALAWFDVANRIGELEPVGVRRDLHRLGLGRAVCLFALQRLQALGAETALVGSRGDDAYPGPRALYESIGFRELWRDLVFVRSTV
jgi:GNAT superfamily N-acetyltransferase